MRGVKSKSHRVAVKIPGVLAVPRTAVLYPGRTASVYRETSSGVYERRQVRLGRQGDNDWEVLDGWEEVWHERFIATFFAAKNMKPHPDHKPSRAACTRFGSHSLTCYGLVCGCMTVLSDDVGATLLEKGAPPALRASQSRLRRVAHMFALHPPS